MNQEGLLRARFSSDSFSKPLEAYYFLPVQSLRHHLRASTKQASKYYTGGSAPRLENLPAAAAKLKVIDVGL